ncbi:MAG: hypothetical protein OEU92_13180 [Alphaproteobacteria bacterium]|nr:hypothetical protein [Alphaproteobacteria bacterium]
MTEQTNDSSEKVYWLDRPKNVSLIVWALVGVCVALFFADAFYHKHPHFEIEHLFGFYGVYGFFVCIALVLVAKSLRAILMRSEDYYDTSEESHHTKDLAHHAHE